MLNTPRLLIFESDEIARPIAGKIEVGAHRRVDEIEEVAQDAIVAAVDDLIQNLDELSPDRREQFKLGLKSVASSVIGFEPRFEIAIQQLDGRRTVATVAW